MSDKNKKKKQYEPPEVREIGGVFEQAMGISSCQTGGGVGASCTVGGNDVGCLAGGSDGAACSKGYGNDYSCAKGAGVG